MTVTYIRPRTPGEQALTVHYATAAAHDASALDEKLRDALVKAIAILADNPYPPQSEAVHGEPLRRVVRASQSLIVTYRADETHLLIEEVRTEDFQGDGAPEPAAPPPDAEGTGADLPEPASRGEAMWQRVEVSAVQAPFPPGPNGSPPGTV